MLKEIIIAVNKKLIELYPDIDIQSKDIKHGFNRPCFFVKLRASQNALLSPNFNERKVSVIIYYFASDPKENAIENLEVQETLENSFLGKLVIDERHFIVHEVSSLVNDGVLQVSFDLDIQSYNDEDLSDANELMGKLITEIKEV